MPRCVWNMLAHLPTGLKVCLYVQIGNEVWNDSQSTKHYDGHEILPATKDQTKSVIHLGPSHSICPTSSYLPSFLSMCTSEFFIVVHKTCQSSFVLQTGLRLIVKWAGRIFPRRLFPQWNRVRDCLASCWCCELSFGKDDFGRAGRKRIPNSRCHDPLAKLSSFQSPKSQLCIHHRSAR